MKNKLSEYRRESAFGKYTLWTLGDPDKTDGDVFVVWCHPLAPTDKRPSFPVNLWFGSMLPSWEPLGPGFANREDAEQWAREFLRDEGHEVGTER